MNTSTPILSVLSFCNTTYCFANSSLLPIFGVSLDSVPIMKFYWHIVVKVWHFILYWLAFNKGKLSVVFSSIVFGLAFFKNGWLDMLRIGLLDFWFLEKRWPEEGLDFTYLVIEISILIQAGDFVLFPPITRLAISGGLIVVFLTRYRTCFLC